MLLVHIENREEFTAWFDIRKLCCFVKGLFV